MHRYEIAEHLQLPHWRLKGLYALYATATIRTLAYSLIGVFVPIYLYQRHESILQVLIYYLIIRVVEIIANYPVVTLLPRLGFARSMLIGNVGLIAHVLLLRMGEFNDTWLYLSAVAVGLMIPFYWIPYHVIFTVDSVKAKLGEEISTMAILGKLANVAGPLMGGVIITSMGFGAVYFGSAILIAISVVPIFFIKDDFSRLALPSLKEVWIYMKSRSFRSSGLALGAIGAESMIQGILWPIFLFLFVGGISVVGGLTTAVLLVNVFVVLIIGRVVDRRGKASVVKVGSYGSAAVWLLKLFAQTVGLAFVVDAAYKTSRSTLGIPFDALIYEKAAKNPLTFMIAREWAVNVGRLLAVVVVLALVVGGFDWIYAFVFAAIASILAVVVVRD